MRYNYGVRSLLLAPHNDDETLFASFLCLRHRPLIVVCLRSMRMAEKSYPHPEFSMTFAEREAETAAAMEILGCEWVQWEIPDTRPNPVPELAAMLALAGEWDQVFAPAVEDGGQFQHDTIGVLADSIFGADKVTHYLTYTTGGRSTDGEEVPYEPEWPALKLRALACYETQIKHPSTRAHFLDGGLREYVQR